MIRPQTQSKDLHTQQNPRLYTENDKRSLKKR